MGNLALLEGWPIVRGIYNKSIHSLSSEMVALYQRWVASGEGVHIEKGHCIICLRTQSFPQHLVHVSAAWEVLTPLTPLTPLL